MRGRAAEQARLNTERAYRDIVEGNVDICAKKVTDRFKALIDGCFRDAMLSRRWSDQKSRDFFYDAAVIDITAINRITDTEVLERLMDKALDADPFPGFSFGIPWLLSAEDIPRGIRADGTDNDAVAQWWDNYFRLPQEEKPSIEEIVRAIQFVRHPDNAAMKKFVILREIKRWHEDDEESSIRDKEGREFGADQFAADILGSARAGIDYYTLCQNIPPKNGSPSPRRRINHLIDFMRQAPRENRPPPDPFLGDIELEEFA